MATHSSALAWKVPWTEEPGRTLLSDFTFIFHFHALKEMAIHSSVLAWRIPGMLLWDQVPNEPQTSTSPWPRGLGLLV